jgi:hypothetical protein
LVRLYMDVETYRPETTGAFVNEKVILVAFLKDETPFSVDSLNKESEVVAFPKEKFTPEYEIIKRTLEYVLVQRSSHRFVDVVGFNILRFDIPLLVARGAANGIDDIANLSKMWYDNFSADHFQLLLPANNRLFTGLSLNNVVKKARELNLRPQPPEPYGKSTEIRTLYEKGDYDEVLKHCLADLRIVRWLDLYGTRALLRISAGSSSPMFKSPSG